MRAWVTGSLALIVLSLASGPAAAQYPGSQYEQDDNDGDDDWLRNCRIENYGETVDCKDEEEGTFWSRNGVEVGLTAFGLALTGMAGFFTTRQVRRRRQAMSGLLMTINSTYAAHKDTPEVGVTKLNELRAEVADRYHKGRMEDAQFIELDKRLAECVTNLRVMALERKFPLLPALLFSELRHVVRDGLLSEADVATVERRAVALKVSASDRRALAESLRQWSGEARPAERRVKMALIVR